MGCFVKWIVEHVTNDNLYCSIDQPFRPREYGNQGPLNIQEEISPSGGLPSAACCVYCHVEVL